MNIAVQVPPKNIEPEGVPGVPRRESPPMS